MATALARDDGHRCPTCGQRVLTARERREAHARTLAQLAATRATIDRIGAHLDDLDKRNAALARQGLTPSGLRIDTGYADFGRWLETRGY